MQPIRARSLSLAGALLLPGCFFDSIEEPAPLPLATSFALTATLSFPAGGEYDELPDSERVLLRLDDAADTSVAAIFASSDGSSTGVFARAGSGITLREPVQLGVISRPGTDEAHLAFESIDLEVLDRDGDGSADAVEGSGSGSFVFLVGDVEFAESFTAELGGALDDSPPDLYLAATDRLHVLDGLTLVASKPLQIPGTAQILSGGVLIPLEMLPAGAPYVTSFHTGAILPFDAEISVRIEPEPRDLAGAGIEYGLERIQTMPAPGLFAEDGFEGELAAVSSGVEVVTGFGTLPAIGGTRSLLVAESWGTVTMRVPLEEGDTHLRFEARALFDGQSGFGCPQSGLRVGFPALDQITALYPVWATDIEEDTGDDRWTAATPVTTVELALPAGAGSELIFDIFQPPSLPGVSCPDAGLLIDDLRAE